MDADGVRVPSQHGDDFVGMPSTKSASDEDAIQSERRELLDKAAASGVIKDYSGVRQASDGRRFRVTGATVWTITDREGNKTGQAVRFDTFAWLGENGEETEMTVADGGELVEKSSGAGDGDVTLGMPEGLPKVGIDDFDLLKVLGKGGFGKVMLVRKKGASSPLHSPQPPLHPPHTLI